MFRPTLPADTPALLELTESTRFFKPMEVATLEEVLNDYHAANRDAGHRCFVSEESGTVTGFVYHAPAAMTENTWYVYWIVVHRDQQGQGIGARLLKFAEDDARSLDGRVLFVETSSVPHYEPTRKFYLKQGYDLEARLRDFYAAGDDMIVFRKSLAGKQ
jgi:GNAT superfamily N-acetyltransferase